MAALHSGLLQHLSLVHATDCHLDNQACVLAQFAGLSTNLLGQLARRRNDNRANVLSAGSVPVPATKRWVGLNYSLDSREEKANGLASTGPCLGDTEKGEDSQSWELQAHTVNRGTDSPTYMSFPCKAGLILID